LRRLPLVLVLVLLFAGSAAAATIRGTARGDVVRGTTRADRVDVAFGGNDRVVCGRGVDHVVADRGDRVASDCETVARRLSVDSLRNTASQHETAVEPDSFAWGSTVVATYQVGRFQSGGASGIGFSLSRDAGRTWQSGLLPSLTVESNPPGTEQRASDPAVAYDSVHGVWLIVTLPLMPDTVIEVSRSTDGLQWQAPIQLARGPLLDKEWIACDNSALSPFRGRCYVVYTDDLLHRLVSQTSMDGGQTWGPPVRVTTDLIGAQPVVRPDGSLVILAADLPTESVGPSRSFAGTLVAFRSDDGGTTFSEGSLVSNFGWHAPLGMRAIPLPSAAAGPDGTVYAAWHACGSGTTCAANQIVISQSRDGLTWAPPVPVTTGTNDHFISALDAHPVRPGRLALVYALFQPGTCTTTVSTCRLGIGFTSSTNGGARWSAQQRLDVTPYAEDWLAEAGGKMVGDYFSLSFAGNRAVPVFTLAEPPLLGRFREAIFAASLPVG
jgi:BNR repeat-like domain